MQGSAPQAPPPPSSSKAPPAPTPPPPSPAREALRALVADTSEKNLRARLSPLLDAMKEFSSAGALLPFPEQEPLAQLEDIVTRYTPQDDAERQEVCANTFLFFSFFR